MKLAERILSSKNKEEIVEGKAEKLSQKAAKWAAELGKSSSIISDTFKDDAGGKGKKAMDLMKKAKEAAEDFGTFLFKEG